MWCGLSCRKKSGQLSAAVINLAYGGGSGSETVFYFFLVCEGDTLPNPARWWVQGAGAVMAHTGWSASWIQLISSASTCEHQSESLRPLRLQWRSWPQRRVFETDGLFTSKWQSRWLWTIAPVLVIELARSLGALSKVLEMTSLIPFCWLAPSGRPSRVLVEAGLLLPPKGHQELLS